MPEIAPFRGILFDPKRVDLARVLAPGPDAAADLARAAPGWLADGQLVRDPYKAVYRYAQHFAAPDGGRALVRRGLIAAVRLAAAAEARILSPERTWATKVDERLALLDATRLHVAPPFGLYADAAGEVERALRPVESRPPTLDVTFPDGVRHVLWRVSDAEIFGKIRRALVPKRTVLADGHHRYAAALALRDRLAAAAGPAGLSQHAAPQYVPMFLCSGADPGLVVAASHRLLVGVDGFEPRGFLERARAYFVVEPVPGGGRDAAVATRALTDVPGHQPAIVVAFPGEAEAWRLTLDAHVNPQALGVAAHPVVAKLDVALLHGLVFERILGLAPAAHEVGDSVRHVASAATALAELPRAQAAFLLAPLSADTLRHVTELGDTLPPRAAWLHPALAPGMVMAGIDPDEDLM